MATVRRRFYNPHNVIHTAGDALEINTVQSVSYSKTWQRLAGQGDNDVTDSFQAKVNLQVAGSIAIQDPVQADALIDRASGSLKWDGVPGTGGTKKTITIEGVEFFSLNETDAHNALDGITLGFNAFKAEGTDPVSIVVAAP